ncbi:unnamed protein product, partial [Dovyalis caffra]
HHLNLLGHAWILFTEGKPLELVVESIIESCNLSELIRSIHIALLCVQEDPADRPSMSCVVLMLGNEETLPQPKQPGFFTDRDLIEVAYSSNKCSISLLEAR